MRFFYAVGITIVFIGVANLIHTGVAMYIPQPIYACSEVTKQDPPDVQKICARRVKWN